MFKKALSGIVILGMAFMLNAGGGVAYAEEIIEGEVEQADGIMLINETEGEGIDMAEESSPDQDLVEGTNDSTSMGRGENEDDGDPAGKASDRDGNFICEDGQIAADEAGCTEIAEEELEETEEVPLWPVIVSAAAIGIMLVVIIILNIRKRK